MFYCGGEIIPSAATDKGLTQASFLFVAPIAGLVNKQLAHGTSVRFDQHGEARRTKRSNSWDGRAGLCRTVVEEVAEQKGTLSIIAGTNFSPLSNSASPR